MRNPTSDLRFLRSDALPLSHRDSTASEVCYEVDSTLSEGHGIVNLCWAVMHHSIMFWFFNFYDLKLK